MQARQRAESAECLSIDIMSRAQKVDNQWVQLSQCEEFVGASRSKHTAVAVADGIVVFGGDDGHKMLNDLIRFDPNETSWSRVVMTGAAPSPRYHHSAVSFRNSMYIFGGYTGNINSNSNLENKNDLYQCNFDKSQWREIVVPGDEDKKPAPRSAHGAAEYGDYMYIFAGFNGQDRLNDMWRINLASAHPQWEEVVQKGRLPPSCCNCPIVVANHSMYVFSGHSGKDTTNNLFRFDLTTNEWEIVKPAHPLHGGARPPPRRFGHTMVHHYGKLYVFGGSADNTLPNTIHSFDLETRRWEVVKPTGDSFVPSGRCFHSATVLNNSMYIFAGTAEFSRDTSQNLRSNEMYRFTLSTTARCTLADDFHALLKHEELCDVVFVVGKAGEKVRAHKAIVAARSPALATAMKAKDESSTDTEVQEVPLPHIESVPAFRAVMQFIYSDKLLEECIGDALDASTLQLLVEIHNQAALFGIPRLEKQCVRCIKMSVNITNVLIILQAVSARCLGSLRDFLLAFAVREMNFKRIIMSKEFERLDQSLMVEIIRKHAEVPADRAAPSGAGGDHVARHSLPSVTSLEAIEDQEEDDSGDLAHDMAYFLAGQAGKDFADVFLLVGEERFHAHKAVLAARSQYFSAMFRSGMKETVTNEVNIVIENSVPSVAAFHSLMKFVYFGGTVMPPEDSLYLLPAPYFYGFANNRLQTVCKRNLETSVSPKNIFAILEAADGIGAVEMKKNALQVIVHNYVKVSRLPAMRALKHSLLLDILDALAKYLAERQTDLHRPISV